MTTMTTMAIMNTMQNVYEIINKLPQEIQDIIWSFNVEGHREKMKKLFDDFEYKKTFICTGCLRIADIKDLADRGELYSFASEYFFSCDSYGLLCSTNDCSGYRNIRRLYSIEHYRTRYIIDRDIRLGIENDYYDDSDSDYDDY
jgi:hypothetical protein